MAIYRELRDAYYLINNQNLLPANDFITHELSAVIEAVERACSKPASGELIQELEVAELIMEPDDGYVSGDEGLTTKADEGYVSGDEDTFWKAARRHFLCGKGITPTGSGKQFGSPLARVCTPQHIDQALCLLGDQPQWRKVREGLWQHGSR